MHTPYEADLDSPYHDAMNPRLPLWILVAVLVAGGVRMGAAGTNQLDVRVLAQRLVPGCTQRLDGTGRLEALVSPRGPVLELATAAKDHPSPTNTQVGYWLTPTMDFLGGEAPVAKTPRAAVEVVQLMHLLWRGPGFVGQKRYGARPIEGGWVVEVDHDFDRVPAMVMAVAPYELLVDRAGKVVRFRQRSYHYLGSATVYTNTVMSVYEREIRRDGGRGYPEKLFRELDRAWEQEQRASKDRGPSAARP